MTAALELEQASVHRQGGLVLDRASVRAVAGEMIAVVGPNGAGKTTLLRAALGLTPLVHGSARLGGRDVATLSDPARARLVAYLPQQRRLAWNVSALRVASLGAIDAPPAMARERGRAALAQVGLEHLADRGVLDMSGGEQARAVLARLLAVQAPLIVADEPTVGLDPDAQLLILELLRREADRGACVVLTLHDLTLAARLCDRLVVIDRGRVVADDAPAAALTPEVLENVFNLHGALVDTPAGSVLAVSRRSDPAV